MRAGDQKLMINLEWPNSVPCVKIDLGCHGDFNTQQGI
jgi:hypothetical protein